MGSRVVRPVWYEGRPALLGYLGQLRRDPSIAGRIDLLGKGFAVVDSHRRPDELPFDLTSIVSDNAAARALLVERGSRGTALPGVPRYLPAGRFRTLVMKVPARCPSPARAIESPHSDDLEALCACHARSVRRFDLAPRLELGALLDQRQHPGLSLHDFMVLRRERGGALRASVAVWDRRAEREVVVEGYAAGLRRWRPALNLLLAARGRPTLPAPGSPLRLAYLAFVAVDGDDLAAFDDLLLGALHRARVRGAELLVAGFAEGDPRLEVARRRCGAWELGSELYIVPSRDVGQGELRSGARSIHVEVATL